jgi:hypothetical protein
LRFKLLPFAPPKFTFPSEPRARVFVKRAPAYPHPRSMRTADRASLPAYTGYPLASRAAFGRTRPFFPGRTICTASPACQHFVHECKRPDPSERKIAGWRSTRRSLCPAEYEGRRDVRVNLPNRVAARRKRSQLICRFCPACGALRPKRQRKSRPRCWAIDPEGLSLR